MISFVKKFSGIGVCEIWFAEKLKFAHSFRLAAYMHIKKKKGRVFAVSQKSYTVENTLLSSEADIFNAFSKTVQVEIKQAEKTGVICGFCNDAEAFVAFYNEFAQHRNIDSTSVRRMMEMQPYLKLTIASYQNNILAAHSYIADEEGKIVRLMHAASQRLSTGADKQLAGRANKLLHYYDMLQFKKNGFAVYDFGGYTMNTTDKGMQGVNKFKLSFGGAIVECKNLSSYPYYILKKIAAAAGRLGRA